MSYKGKGKDKAKGKAPASKPQGHTLPRTRVSAEKFSGVVTFWKGKYGWIKPSEEIEHEKASLRNGSLFASINDIMDGSGELHPGAPCEFHIWEDETGLGAEEILETGPPDPSAIPKEQGKSGPKGAGKAMGGGKAPQSNGWGGDKGYGKAPTKTFSKGWSEPYGGKGAKGKDTWGGGKDSWGGGFGKGKDSWGGGKDSWGGGKDAWGGGKDAYGSFGKAKGDKGAFGKGKGDKGKGKSKHGGKGHLLPRTRVSAEKFQGTVTSWKGKYGWITPNEEIEHEKAKANRGALFVSKDNLEGGLTELTEGATVEFHIWEDETGLGAEEVAQY